jgi:hypothetical protein
MGEKAGEIVITNHLTCSPEEFADAEATYMWRWLRVRASMGNGLLKFTDREWHHFRLLTSFGLKRDKCGMYERHPVA